MIFKRIDHVEIIPEDVERTIDFYVNILNFKIKFRREVPKPPMKEIIFLELNDSLVEIISADPTVPRSGEPWQVGYRGIALEVENMEEAVKYLKSHGVDMVQEPVDAGATIRGTLRDPDGLSIEIRQYK